MEVIAKLCGSVSQSSLQMVENPDGTALHPLMQRLHEIAAEAGGNVTYTAVKAVLVSEFGQNVFEEHKTTLSNHKRTIHATKYTSFNQTESPIYFTHHVNHCCTNRSFNHIQIN